MYIENNRKGMIVEEEELNLFTRNLPSNSDIGDIWKRDYDMKFCESDDQQREEYLGILVIRKRTHSPQKRAELQRRSCLER